MSRRRPLVRVDARSTLLDAARLGLSFALGVGVGASIARARARRPADGDATEREYVEHDALEYGWPSDAVSHIESKSSYAHAFDGRTRNPRWVMEAGRERRSRVRGRGKSRNSTRMNPRRGNTARGSMIFAGAATTEVTSWPPRIRSERKAAWAPTR